MEVVVVSEAEFVRATIKSSLEEMYFDEYFLLITPSISTSSPKRPDRGFYLLASSRGSPYPCTSNFLQNSLDVALGVHGRALDDGVADFLNFCDTPLPYLVMVEPIVTVRVQTTVPDVWPSR